MEAEARIKKKNAPHSGTAPTSNEEKSDGRATEAQRTFTHVFDPAGISSAPQGVRNANALLRGEREVLFRIPPVGCAKIATFFYDPFHR